MITKPCDCCKFPTTGTEKPGAYICHTCVQVYIGEWPDYYEPKMTRNDVIKKINAIRREKGPIPR